MLRIGAIELSPPLVLAPLSGVSDLPFRLMNRKFGCGLAFTEMVSAEALKRKIPRTLRMLDTANGDRPLGLQLLSANGDSLRQALDALSMDDYAVVDLNAACPVKKVVRRGEGAALMREPRKLADLVGIIAGRCPLPVTVKLRAGWDHDSINAKEAALQARGAGASAVFVHGRTRAQGYRGGVDYEVIREVKKALDIPVIASGDVLSPRMAKKMFDETGCDGVVVARGAMGNPWIFPHTKALLETGFVPERPGSREIAAAMLEHLALCARHHGPEKAARVFRKCFMWYTKGLAGAKPLRLKAMKAETGEEMAGIVKEAAALGEGGKKSPLFFTGGR